MDQSISAKNLSRIIRREDIWKLGLGSKRGEIRERLQQISDQANDPNFNFSIPAISKVNGSLTYSASNSAEKIILRWLSESIRRSLNIKPSDRNDVIPQISNITKAWTEHSVHKRDISKFFESIDKDFLLKSIRQEYSLSPTTLRLTERFLTCAHFPRGLPRGISLSSILSEYYLRDFERFCKALRGVHFYSRYVDDMIFVCHETRRGESLSVDLQERLPPGLQLNTEKSTDVFIDSKGNVTSPQNSIDFLGYEFSFRRHGDVAVRISAKKLSKLKSRITISLRQFIKDGKFQSLLKRIQILTTNFEVQGKSRLGRLYTGIFYNNRWADKSEIQEQLKELDRYLIRAVHSKRGKFGASLSSKLTRTQREIICSNLFSAGFNSPKYRRFNEDELKSAKKAWNHV